MIRFILAVLLLPTLALAQISNSPFSVNSSSLSHTVEFTANLAQSAGTYDLAIAAGDLMIDSIAFYNETAGSGLVSVSFATNSTSPTTLLTAVALVGLTGGINLNGFTGPVALMDTKKIRYTIIGTGSAGTVKAIVKFTSPSGGGLS